VGHKCYISFKTEDAAYKSFVQDHMTIDMIDKSLNVAIESSNPDYIMQVIRREYLSDSTVTIHLIGEYGSEQRGPYEQRFIKRELQASLYDSQVNPRNGILGVVLPSMLGAVYRGDSVCNTCGRSHSIVNISDSTTVREFSWNYYIPNGKCAHEEADRYCVLATWSNFVTAPEAWIDAAFAKRTAPIANRVRVYP
jgi:hypothetical protein